MRSKNVLFSHSRSTNSEKNLIYGQIKYNYPCNVLVSMYKLEHYFDPKSVNIKKNLINIHHCRISFEKKERLNLPPCRPLKLFKHYMHCHIFY